MLGRIITKIKKFLLFWNASETIEILDNGLVSNIHYYKELPNKRGYLVANQNLDFSFGSILFEDYLTLNNGYYISSFIIDHVLHILNTTLIIK